MDFDQNAPVPAIQGFTKMAKISMATDSAAPIFLANAFGAICLVWIIRSNV